ncbi:uncharacterized protein LOC131230358 [Magnolia sinica]|uniref:uncharacterized protein LOC131230358 n=1 Tax=Magnolia sinica TaxID=86752 RepID=UPI00265A99FB|nr:uncharacterized protein LOC131230358 [Magnolia sinica]
MEGFGCSGFIGASGVTKKRRSNTSRRPRPDANPFVDGQDHSPSSSTPPSDNVSKVSSDENVGYDAGFQRKEMNLNSTASRFPSYNQVEGEALPKKSRKDGAFGEIDGFYSSGSSRAGSVIRNEKGRNASDFKRCSEGVLAPANWKNASKVNFDFQSDSHNSEGRNGDSRSLGQSGVTLNGSGSRGDSSSNENKLRKVKLKVGGVTRTIHAKPTPDSATDGSSTKPPRSADAPRQRQRLILQDNSDDDSPPYKTNGLQGIPWKNFSGGGGVTLALKAESRGKMSGSLSAKQTDKSHGIPSSEPVRKSKRVPKRRVLDGALDDEDEDDELRYLGRLKIAKANADYITDYDDGEEDSRKRRTLKTSRSRIAAGEYDGVDGYGLLRSSKEGKKKSRLERGSEDADYIEDEDYDEPGSDGGFDANMRKKQRKESLDSLADTKKEISLTTRQRALQSGKDVSSTSLVEFPNGLPPAPPRKQKEKLSEVEQQLKKAEAAQRRRMQVEKAARESEAEAIRKILGQDSSRKKKEDKLRKQRDELARERAANAMTLPSNTVRWIMGPTGTVVTFPKDLGLPSIFDSKPCSYPAPREKCAGPSCTNAYKYRDSKSKLPLCSLQCYRAVNETMRPVTTC